MAGAGEDALDSAGYPARRITLLFNMLNEYRARGRCFESAYARLAGKSNLTPPGGGLTGGPLVSAPQPSERRDSRAFAYLFVQPERCAIDTQACARNPRATHAIKRPQISRNSGGIRVTVAITENSRALMAA